MLAITFVTQNSALRIISRAQKYEAYRECVVIWISLTLQCPASYGIFMRLSTRRLEWIKYRLPSHNTPTFMLLAAYPNLNFLCLLPDFMAPFLKTLQLIPFCAIGRDQIHQLIHISVRRIKRWDTIAPI